MKPLPKEVFVKREKIGDSSSETFLFADDDFYKLAAVNEKLIVGRYELVETLELRMVAQLHPVSGK